MPLKNERSAVESTRWIAALDRMEAVLIQIRLASEAKDPPAAPVVAMPAEVAEDPWPQGIAALAEQLKALHDCDVRAAGVTADIDRSLADCESDLSLWWDDAVRRKQRLEQALQTSL